jgi:CsoR family transcriptional regulator, copper-sensing transcriptional repressor
MYIGVWSILKERGIPMSKESILFEQVIQQDPGFCSPGEDKRKSHHSDQANSDLLNRLNRIEGQVRGIKGMIEKDIYCDDMLNQISLVQASLNDVGKLVLEYHMKSCVIERIQVGDTEVLTEFMKTINKLMK